MIGNLWEYTDEWKMAPGAGMTAGAMSDWPDPDFRGDGLWNVGSQSFDGIRWSNVPSAVERGGSRNDGTKAGVFAVTITPAVHTVSSDREGFRCVHN